MVTDGLRRTALCAFLLAAAGCAAAAACLGIDDIGTLEVGRRADFVVLSDDPLMDVRNARSIESVWMGGERIR